MIKILLYLAAGGVLLAANVWFIRSVWREFQSGSVAAVIMPMQLIGQDDPQQARGRALAQLLAARMAALQQEIRAAEDALASIGSIPQPIQRGQALLVSPNAPAPFGLNARVLEIPTVDLKVGGVDVSGVLSWLARGLAEEHAIRVTLYRSDPAAKYTVAAEVGVPDMSGIWLPNLAADDLGVIDEVALELVRQQVLLQKSFPEAAGLSRREFATLIATLRQSARLNFELKSGVQPAATDYQEIVTDLEPLLERAPQWWQLLELAATAAENAHNVEQALVLAQRRVTAFDQLHAGKTLTTQQQTERDALAARVARLQALDAPLVLEERAGYPLAMVDMPPASRAHGAPRVAILGGTPLPAQRSQLGAIEILDGATEGKAADAMREHIGAVAAVVRSVAPQAVLVFAGMKSNSGMVGTADIFASLDTLARSKPDVLIIPLAIDESRTPASAAATVLKRLSENMIVVVAAGNERASAQFDYPELVDRILIVSAVDARGRPAVYAPGSPNVVWAPGNDIPVAAMDAKSRSIAQRQSGTSFSAAIAGGIAAWLRGQDAQLSAVEAVRVLRESAQAPSGDNAAGSVRILQLNAALELLQARENKAH